ncbi:hypothetical protein, partial [Bacillus altitudinis]|uniref:hypothetical protein n=1 Tax=Bacillus altitudinis TaxID=293387 RepID=UPI0020CCD136
NPWFHGFLMISLLESLSQCKQVLRFDLPPKAWVHPVTESCRKHGNVHLVMKTGDEPVLFFGHSNNLFTLPYT